MSSLIGTNTSSNKLSILENELRNACFLAPKWMQLELQGFWYGLISFAITYAEQNKPFLPNDVSIETILTHSDESFEGWPTYWLEPTLRTFLSTNLSFDELNTWFETLDSIFRDCVPTDLNIFIVLQNGDILTEEQWSRLYEAIAFVPPSSNTSSKKNTKHSKTRHIHGKRAITPMRCRKAITHKKQKPTYSFIKLS
jgi:hypothetical protein